MTEQSKNGHARDLVLTYLAQNSGSGIRNDVIAWGVENGDHSDEDLIPLSRDRSRAAIRMGFALTALKREYGLVDNDRARWFLTEAGRAHLGVDFDDEHDESAFDPPASVEGRVVLRSHRVRERDASLVAKKKAEALSANGVLRCEVCGLDPVARYGDVGDSIIECHHLRPLSLGDLRETRLEDLALVCRNCHGAIHGAGTTRTLGETRSLLRSAP